jgi:N-acetylglucosaminyldiphosphoundecaprenol N-acetyl-beta-D-mannosaminyltransferase
LVTSQTDAEFRASLLLSDLCTADGMPLVWLSRLLGIPIRERVAGADVFEALKNVNGPLRVFLFGGAEGIATAACKRMNSDLNSLTCVGSIFPGFGDVDEMSSDSIVETINASKADFLLAALGAKKGQKWLLRNHDQIRIPVRAHLGATIGFQAGHLRRSPVYLQKLGLEWLWRIKEEPHLWTRYWNDGWVFLRLLLTRLLPLIVISKFLEMRWRKKASLSIDRSEDQNSVILALNGLATARNIEKAIVAFEQAMLAKKDIVINLGNTRLIDARFLGLLSVLDIELGKQRLHAKFADVPRPVRSILRLSGFEFLQRHH